MYFIGAPLRSCIGAPQSARSTCRMERDTNSRVARVELWTVSSVSESIEPAIEYDEPLDARRILSRGLPRLQHGESDSVLATQPIPAGQLARLDQVVHGAFATAQIRRNLTEHQHALGSRLDDGGVHAYHLSISLKASVTSGSSMNASSKSSASQ